MNGVFGELRLGVRVLRRRPGYALTVIATLALGIAAVTAVFTLVDRVLLRPLPFPDASQLVLIRQQNPQADWNTSVVDHQAIAAQTRSLESVASMRTMDVILTGGAEPRWVSARSVTADFFRVLGIAPARGRGFNAGEDQPGAARAVVLGHAFAERQFGGADPLGRSLVLDGLPHTVVGIMPPGMESLSVVRADLWPILQLEAPERRGPFFLGTIARMKSATTVEQSADDLAEISRRLFPLWQQGFQDSTARLVPRSLHDAVIGGSQRFLWVALGAVIVVLLIAVVNVANLVLMRSAERSQDLSVHAALGASRRRIGRILIVESLLLTTIGAAAGLALAVILLELYRTLGPVLPRLAEVSIDLRVTALAGGVALASGLLFGTLPLLFDGVGRRARVPTQARGASASRGQQWLRQALVALEFALALPLLVAAGLLIHSLYQLQRVDPGFDSSHLLTARLRLLETNHPDTMERFAFWTRTLDELRAIPGVSAAGLADVVPPSCGCYNNFDLVGRPADQGNQPQSPWIAVTRDYFETLGVPVLDGRGFDDGRDTPDSPPVLVVTASWAKRYFPGESPVGKRLYEGGDTTREVEIVGVVGDVRFDGLESAGDAVFAPVSQGWRNNPIYLHLRTGPEPLALVEPVRAALQRLDPTLVPAEVSTMEGLLADSLGTHRHWAAVIAGFALSAVALAAIGVFGVLAYYVSRQQREIGIRLALGADTRRVASMVMRRGIACAIAGTALGVVLALFLTKGLEALLFEVERLDPINLIGACFLLLAIAVAACWLPARRAAGIDPMIALRHE